MLWCKFVYIFIVLSVRVYFWLSIVFSFELNTTVFCMCLIYVLYKCGVLKGCIFCCVYAEAVKAEWYFCVFLSFSFSKCTWTGPLLIGIVCFLWRQHLVSQYWPAHCNSHFSIKLCSCMYRLPWWHSYGLGHLTN